MTSDQKQALEALRGQFDYLERSQETAGKLSVDCYRGTLELQHVGTAVVHTNGFVDWYRAR